MSFMLPYIPAALSFLAGGKAATAPQPKMDPALFGTPDASMLNPTSDPGFQQTVHGLQGTAQQEFQGSIPQIASLMTARFGAGGGGAPGMESTLYGNARNAAFASIIPQIAQLMAQQRNMGLTRYMSGMNAARSWQMQRAQQIAQQHASLASGFMDLGGKLLGAAMFHGKNSTQNPFANAASDGGGFPDFPPGYLGAG